MSVHVRLLRRSNAAGGPGTQSQHYNPYELAYRDGWGDPRQMLERYYREQGKATPGTLQLALQGVPSFLDATEKLLGEMKQRRAQRLVVDLQGNGGGATPMVFPFLYQLYGEAYLRHRFPGEFITVQSELYLKKLNTTAEALRGA